MLRFENVRFQYDTEEASIIDGLSFAVKAGEFVSLIGASGFGKSTIFRLITGLLQPSSGHILVGGKDILTQRHYCGYMPQTDLLLPWCSVLENVRLPLEIQGGRSRSEMDGMAAQALKKVGLSGWEKKPPSALSGGMRQRAAFARTVLTGSDLLLLDEPFSALDYLTRLEMREWVLQQWEEEKKTIVFITHDVEEAVFLSGRVLVAEKSPIRSLASIDVPVDYPRTVRSLSDPAATQLKEMLITRLRASEEDVQERGHQV